MHNHTYREPLRLSRRHARRPDEAEDLLHDALLAAVAVGRDPTEPGNRRWFAGVVRNQATLAARGAVRRRRRETRWASERQLQAPADGLVVGAVLAGLPPSLKAVAALALSGHSRREIAYLLGLTDTALRQRLTGLRRALAQRGLAWPAETPGLTLDLHYGRLRDWLLPLLRTQSGTIASHDPDGHLFVLRGAHKTIPRGN